MSKKLQLSIPTPCHENWDNMTPVQQGKFCGSCQKQVVDFSNMSDRQVAEFFKKPSTGSVCGRFMSDQLERDIEIPRKRIPWLKYFFQFALPAFLVSLKASAEKTQGLIKMKTVTTDTTKRPLEVKLGEVAKPTCIKPSIVDIEKIPVKQEADPRITIRGYVSIRLGGVAAKRKNNEPLIVIDGIVQHKFIFDKLDPKAIDSVSILKGIQGVAIYGPDGVNGVIVVKTKKINKVEPVSIKSEVPKISFLKVYPNPVQSGSSLNIEWKQTEEGYYTLQLLNQSGQSVYQKEIWIDADARLLSIDIPFVTAGSYFISLTNRKSGKRFTEKIILE